ncbi:MAG: PilZ domain-containing protein [Deltaproteobacteria bacterium]|nr:PilZ domain-containing protein [Deltaproteobacteria bacterium]MBW2448295.1 PilZ domain-containing protein [Deltaproteobacteria bacterium]
MSAPLRVTYSTPEDLRQQYETQIALGGLFIPTVSNLEFRESVRVVFNLEFCNDRVELDAEVVSVVEPELAGPGNEAGVAIQFTDTAEKVKKQLGPFIGVNQADERRRAPRRVARVPVLIEPDDGRRLTGRTRDLSHSGLLASIDGPPVAVGRTVKITLDHPTFDEKLSVSAQIVRHLDVEGTVTALACEFQVPAEREKEITQFIDDVQTSEHGRRLRGVSGAIGELGIINVIQVFGGCTRSGTLTVIRGYEEGRVVFEDGLLREVRLGPVLGVKALARIVGWREGNFEFHARVEPSWDEVEPCSLDASLLEATRQQDELARVELAFTPGSRFKVDRKKLDIERSGLSKLEDSVAELAGAGMTMRQVLDVIPESDVDIQKAFAALSDLALIRARG